MVRRSTNSILKEIEEERERRAALTRDDLEREYEAVRLSGYDIGLVLTFQAHLKDSMQIAYHYEVVLKEWKREGMDPDDFEHSFAARRKEGRDFLFPLLDERGEFESVHIAYLIAQSFCREKFCEEEPERERLTPYLLRYAALSEPVLRRKAIIALGWVYAPGRFQEELACLCDHLLKDEDVLCRAWSASALMQLFFHGAPAEAIRECALPSLRLCLEKEKDDFVVGVAIESFQELWGVKLRLSQVAVERRDHDVIEKARKRALKYVNRSFGVDRP
ncbi:HEAT repeat domain-containing protein [Desulfovibrio sp. SGI.169]|uniref:HEAT repeat domain-containing protein n=1 Tax=Desulfovibrio sp. SGI.169 TaxID=3420561 RepID=UPI003CFE116F